MLRSRLFKWLPLGGFVLLAVQSGELRGANVTFDNDVDLTWENASNWDTDTVPTSDLTTDVAAFGSVASGSTKTIAANTTVGGLSFTNGTHTIDASAGSPTLTIGREGVTVGAGSTLTTINVDLTFDGSSGGPIDDAITANADAVFNGNLTFNSTYLLTSTTNSFNFIASGATHTFNGTLNFDHGANEIVMYSNGGTIDINSDNTGNITASHITLHDNGNNGSTWILGADDALDNLELRNQSLKDLKLYQDTAGTTQANALRIDGIRGAGNTIIVGGQNTSGTVTYSGNITLNMPSNETHVMDFQWEAAAGGIVDFTGNMDYTNTYTSAVNDSFTKTGAGTVKLSGTFDLDNNNASSDINVVVSAGTLLLGNSDRISNNADLNLSGGTFSTGGFDETVDNLTLTANSVIDLDGGNSVLNFTDYTYTAGTLSIYNWDGIINNGGGNDQLLFSSVPVSFDGTKVLFYRDAGSDFIGYGEFTAGGELVAYEVPEASTWLSLSALLGLLGWRERRRLFRAV